MRLWHYVANWEADLLMVSDTEPDVDAMEEHAILEMHGDTPDLSNLRLIPEGSTLPPNLARLVPYGQPYEKHTAGDILSGEAERKAKATAEFYSRMAAEDAERAHDGIERNYNEGGWAKPLEREVAWVLAQPCPVCSGNIDLVKDKAEWAIRCKHLEVRHEDLRKCVSDWRLRFFRQERPFQKYYGEEKS